MKKKKRKNLSLTYCSKYDISFPTFSDILIDPENKVHRIVYTPCPVEECDGLDKYGRQCFSSYSSTIQIIDRK